MNTAVYSLFRSKIEYFWKIIFIALQRPLYTLPVTTSLKCNQFFFLIDEFWLSYGFKFCKNRVNKIIFVFGIFYSILFVWLINVFVCGSRLYFHCCKVLQCMDMYFYLSTLILRKYLWCFQFLANTNSCQHDTNDTAKML